MASPNPIFNPLDPAFVADPYPFYHRLRSEDPVHLTPLGFWVLTRYADIMTMLRDPRFGRKGFDALLKERFGEHTGFGKSMLHKDPPDHTRLRTLVNKAFTSRVIESMRPHIQEIVDDLLGPLEDAGSMDLIADLAYPLPVIVISEMLGVPVADRERFRQWSLDIARSLDAIAIPGDDSIVERGNAANGALGEYFRALIAERRRRPQEDLLTNLIVAEEQGDQLTEEELLATLSLLLIAGHETTVNLIGNGMLALLRHPAELKRLRDDPTLIVSAVEELLRYDGPVQRTARMPQTDIELDGKTIPKGALVVGALGAANRDPAQFPDPDRLDITRGDPRHLAFGWGIHFCLGAPLARVEGQIAINTLLRRMPRLTLATDTPEWRETSTLRGLKALPLATA